MIVELTGLVSNSRIPAIKAYREVTMLSIVDAKTHVDSIMQGHPIQVDLNSEQVKKLLENGFTIKSPIKKEIKILMNQLIQKFLLMKKDKEAQTLINMWLELIKEEKNAI